MENWAARERLRLIERAVWWRGWVGRPDLVAMFGISAAQASSDLQKYQELNPGALSYQMSRKRYEGAPGMRCVLHEPSLEEGMATFLMESPVAGGMLASAGGPRVAAVVPPRREVPPGVSRAVFHAVCGGRRLRIHYASVRSSSRAWRWIVPHAFGHDGLRWHVRAWCERAEQFRDFVLGRIRDTEWPEAAAGELPPDEAWDEMIACRYVVNRGLGAEQREALMLDYGTDSDGVLTIRCRRAMRQYVEAMLRVPVEGAEGLPGHFERVEVPAPTGDE